MIAYVFYMWSIKYCAIALVNCFCCSCLIFGWFIPVPAFIWMIFLFIFFYFLASLFEKERFFEKTSFNHAPRKTPLIPCAETRSPLIAKRIVRASQKRCVCCIRFIDATGQNAWWWRINYRRYRTDQKTIEILHQTRNYNVTVLHNLSISDRFIFLKRKKNIYVSDFSILPCRISDASQQVYQQRIEFFCSADSVSLLWAHRFT